MECKNLIHIRNEEFWNSMTHFIGLILSIIGIPFLFYFDNSLTIFSLLSLILFSIGLLFVYTSSTLYHYVQDYKLKKKFQVLDHISIFYLILGSYAPVCLITLYNSSGLLIFLIVFLLAISGTIFKLFYTGKLEVLSMILYLVMGWLIIIDINSLFDIINYKAKLLLVLGGLSYTFGILFYAFDKIKYFHSIWHLFVLTGSVLHYLLILFYII